MDRGRDRPAPQPDPGRAREARGFVAPGKTTLTSKLPGSAGRAVQRQPIGPGPGPAPGPRRSAWEQHFGAVAGEYAEVILDHLPEIIGITAGFIMAESLSAFLAATPTGVGQLAAVVIQLGLAAFGASVAIEACGQALEHGTQWLTLAWTAHGDEAQLAAASRQFLKMLVSIAMAALAMGGVRANTGKGLKVANAIEIRPPMLATPAMAGGGPALTPGGPVLVPGSITSTGPVHLGTPSLMSATGAGGGKAASESSTSTTKSPKGESNTWPKHHPFPKYLGGAADQTLKKIPRSLHYRFHAALDRWKGGKYAQQGRLTFPGARQEHGHQGPA